MNKKFFLLLAFISLNTTAVLFSAEATEQDVAAEETSEEVAVEEKATQKAPGNCGCPH